MELHRRMQIVFTEALSELWSRRSLFTLHGKSLLLTEVFLPDLAAL
jgi:chorismate-pyruvate lyase